MTDNATLDNLGGLSALHTIHDSLTIAHNLALTELGMTDLSSVNGTAVVVTNPELNVCAAEEWAEDWGASSMSVSGNHPCE